MGSNPAHPTSMVMDAQYHREYYERTKEVRRQQKRENHKKRKAVAYEKVRAFLISNPCVDCGETDPVVLQFDHVRGEKDRAISELIARGSSLEKIFAEIEKCDVRCANCHLRKTAIDQGWYTFFNGAYDN